MVAALINDVLVVVGNFKLSILLPKVIWLDLPKALQGEGVVHFDHVFFVRNQKVPDF